MSANFPQYLVKKNLLFTSGLAAVKEDGAIEGVGSVYLQARHILTTLKRICDSTGFFLEDITRLRITLFSLEDLEEVEKAIGEFFIKKLPVTAFTESGNFPHQDALIQIEADAVKN